MPPLYTEMEPMDVQRRLIEAVDMRYLEIVKGIFKSDEWQGQTFGPDNQVPIPKATLRLLCPRDPATERFTCAFCPGVTHSQSGHALEHIQDHFGMRPFACAAENWWVLRFVQAWVADANG
jgi:hypothetical protein